MNHYDGPIRNTEQQLDRIYHTLMRLLRAHGNVRNYEEPKPFSGAKPTYVGFSSSNFIVQEDPIPGITGDALRSYSSF
jgi:hypothetical protein